MMKMTFLPKSIILTAVFSMGLFDWAYNGSLTKASNVRDFTSSALADEVGERELDELVEIIPFVEVTSEPAALKALTVEDIIGRAGHRIPTSIEISPPELARKLTILVRGLPDGVVFSAGRPLNDGQWQLEARSIRGVMLTAPEGIAGTFELEMTLYTASGKVEPEVTERVDLTLKGSSDANIEPSILTAIATPDLDQTTIPNETVEQDSSPSDTVPDHGQTSVPKLSTQQLNALVTRGRQMMDGGDLSGAQLIFEHVEKHITSYSSGVDISSISLELGKLYDPILAAQRLASIPPNPELARKWYGLAANHGNVEAIKRLQLLEKQLSSGELSEQFVRELEEPASFKGNTGITQRVM